MYDAMKCSETITESLDTTATIATTNAGGGRRPCRSSPYRDVMAHTNFHCGQTLTKWFVLSLFFLSFVLWTTQNHGCWRTTSTCSESSLTLKKPMDNANTMFVASSSLPRNDVPPFSFSAFDQSLYHDAAVPGPVQKYPCQPRKIHLSPSSDVDPISQTVNMTLSFTLDRIHCQMTDEKDDDPDHDASSEEEERKGIRLHITIVYGRGIFPEGHVDYDHSNDHNHDDHNIVHFDFISPVTGEHYQSDWIHHITLPYLKAGRHSYWYRILVQQQHHHQQQQQWYDTMTMTNHRSEMEISSPMMTMLPLLLRPPVFLRGSLWKVGESPTYQFRTPPLYNQPTALAFVGDLGQTENSTKTRNHILRSAISNNVDDRIPPVTALFIAGDLSYSDGDPRRWDSWLELMEPLLRTLPFVSTPGNHEIECDNVTHNVFVPYESWFRNPNRIARVDMIPPTDQYIDTLWRRQCNAPSQFLGHYNFGNAFYQYKHGLVHVVVLNSYTSIIEGSVQYQWFTQVALPNIDRQKTPWLIIMFHCPLYTTFVGHNDEINPTLMKSSIQDLLKEHKVNLVISGHDHAYLRTHPVHHDKKDPTSRSPMYWTLGAGGNREQHTKGYIHELPEEWVAKRDNDEYGFGHFFAKNATHAHLQWIRDGTSSSQVVRDSVWIENYYYDGSGAL